MRGTDLGQKRIGEQVVLALGEPAPHFDLNAVRALEVLTRLALKERIDFDLIDRGCDLCATRSTSRSGWKFATPIERARPST